MCVFKLGCMVSKTGAGRVFQTRGPVLRSRSARRLSRCGDNLPSRRAAACTVVWTTVRVMVCLNSQKNSKIKFTLFEQKQSCVCWIIADIYLLLKRCDCFTL